MGEVAPHLDHVLRLNRTWGEVCQNLLQLVGRHAVLGLTSSVVPPRRNGLQRSTAQPTSERRDREIAPFGDCSDYRSWDSC
jgi:hypothetical protein